MRVVVVFAVVALAGCNALLGLDDPARVPDAAIDAPDAPRNVMSAPCTQFDNTLVLCIDFDADPYDHSPAMNKVVAQNVTTIAGVSGNAGMFDDKSRLTVEDSASLSVSEITIEAWIKIDQPPMTGLRAGILDKDQAYGLFVYPSTMTSVAVRCLQSLGTALDIGAPVGTWFHVACTYDHAKVVTYLNGVLAGSFTAGVDIVPSTAPLELAGNSPTGNDRLLGELDSVRVYNYGLTRDQICADEPALACH